MSEITFIRDNKQITILDDGSVTVVVVDKCDRCHEWEPYAAGWTFYGAGGEELLWLCATCRR